MMLDADELPNQLYGSLRPAVFLPFTIWLRGAALLVVLLQLWRALSSLLFLCVGQPHASSSPATEKKGREATNQIRNITVGSESINPPTCQKRIEGEKMLLTCKIISWIRDYFMYKESRIYSICLFCKKLSFECIFTFKSRRIWSQFPI